MAGILKRISKNNTAKVFLIFLVGIIFFGASIFTGTSAEGDIDTLAGIGIIFFGIGSIMGVVYAIQKKKKR